MAVTPDSDVGHLIDQRQNLLTGAIEEEVAQEWAESAVTSHVTVRIIDRWWAEMGLTSK